MKRETARIILQRTADGKLDDRSQLTMQFFQTLLEYVEHLEESRSQQKVKSNVILKGEIPK